MKKMIMLLLFGALSTPIFAQELNLHFGQTQVKEGTQSGGFFVAQIKLSEPSEKAVSVSYETLDGTAKAGEDYNHTAGTVTFSPGETSKSVQFSAIPDDIAEEPLKRFLFTLKNPVNAVLGKGTQVLTIKDDDVELNIVGMPSVTEPDEGETTKMRFTIESKYPFEKDFLLIGYETLDGNGTATAGEDYQSAFGNVALKKGSLRTTFDVVIIGDNEIEPNEYLEVKITAHDEGVSVGKDTQRGVIIDSDGEMYYKYDLNMKVYSPDVTGPTVVAKTSGEIKLEQTTTDEGTKIFIGEETPLEHSSKYHRIGYIQTRPGGTTARFYTTGDEFTLDKMRIDWTIAPYPECKMPMMPKYNRCPWFGVFVEGLRDDFTPDPQAGGGYFTVKDLEVDNTRTEDGLSILKKEIKKRYSLGEKDTTDLTLKHQIIRR